MDTKNIRDDLNKLKSEIQETEKKVLKVIEEYKNRINLLEDKLNNLECVNKGQKGEKYKDNERHENKIIKRQEDMSIKIKGINTNNSEDSELKNVIENIKNNFIVCDTEEVKKSMRAVKESQYRKNIIELTKYNLSSENISLDDGYTLMLISVFMGCLQTLLDSSKYLRDLLKSKKSDGELIRIINTEKDISLRNKLDITSRIYLGSNRGKIKHIDKSVLDRAAELLYQLFYGVIDKVIITENIMETCKFDNSPLKIKSGYLKLVDEKGNNNYLLVSEPVCENCGHLHISQKSFKKLEKRADGYKINI